MSTFVTGSPEGIERRVFGSTASIHSRNRTTKATWQKCTDSFTECPSRDHLVGILDKQVETNRFNKAPVCLTLVELQKADPLASDFSEATMAVVSKIFRSHLRPGDQIVRYRRKTLGLILAETDEAGGVVICQRLHKAISRKLYFGRNAVFVTPIFASFGDKDSERARGEELLFEAERKLEQARALSA